MREATSRDEFARLVGASVGQIDDLCACGLLDPDGDDRFDDVDLVRYDTVRHFLDDGGTVDQLAEQIQHGTFAAMFGGRLFGRREAVTIDEAAESTGITPEQLRALFIASGLPREALHVGDERMGEAVRAALAAGLPWEAVLDLARVMGDSLRRVAESAIRLVHVHVHERMIAAGVPNQDVSRLVLAIQENAGPLLEPAILWVFGEHLLQAAIEDAFLHAFSTTPSGAALGSVMATIVFADVAGFTELVERAGDAAAASTLDRVDGIVRSLSLDHDGKLVKQIGDGFMLAFRDPPDGVRFAVALQHATGPPHDLPGMRIGLNHGTVLYRGGDYVGSAVNVASRVTGAAMAGQVLMTESVASSDHGVDLEQVGVRLLRGVDAPLPLWRVVAQEPARDPVCGSVVVGTPAARLTRDGADVVFCSDECLRAFVATPAS
ncbi:MAG TPA: adenylate/guanylate cyclase domain-containing protein [Acidimicrobiia bacterium]|jgi:adenylate cyclase